MTEDIINDYGSLVKLNYEKITLLDLSHKVNVNDVEKVIDYLKKNKAIVSLSENNLLEDISFMFNINLVRALTNPKDKTYYENFLLNRCESLNIDSDAIFKKIESAIPNIVIYSPKLSHTSANVEGPFSFPNQKHKNFFYSATTKFPVQQYNYVGNAAYNGFGMCFTMLFEYKNEYFSLFGKSNSMEFVEKVLEKTIIKDKAKEIAILLKNIFNDKHENKEIFNVNVSPLIKQIYFPISSNEDNLLLILNNGGLRKGMSHYLSIKRNFFVKPGKKSEEKVISSIRIPTRNMNMGGSNAQNIGEVLSSVSGNLRMLRSDAPSFTGRMGIRPNQIEKIKNTKNIFSIIQQTKKIINSKDEDKKNFEIKRVIENDLRNNKSSKIFKKIVVGNLCKEMLSPIFNAISFSEAFEEYSESFSESQKKFVFPNIYKGSITSEDYDILTNEASRVIRSKLVIVLNKEVIMFDKEFSDLITQETKNILRRF